MAHGQAGPPTPAFPCVTALGWPDTYKGAPAMLPGNVYHKILIRSRLQSKEWDTIQEMYLNFF